MTCHGTLKLGSSKQGNALRASIDSNCVKTYQLGAVLFLEQAVAACLVELSVVGDLELGRAGLECGRGRKSSELFPAGFGLGRHGATRLDELRVVERQVAGVQPDDIGGFVDIEIDLDAAGKGVLFGNKRQVETISHGPDIIPQAQFGRLGRNTNDEQKETTEGTQHY